MCGNVAVKKTKDSYRSGLNTPTLIFENLKQPVEISKIHLIIFKSCIDFQTYEVFNIYELYEARTTDTQ